MRILAVSPFHDSSVAVFADGKLEFFAKEERLTRKKRDEKPWKTLQLVKEKFGNSIDIAVITSPTNNDPGEREYIRMLQKMFDCEIDNLSRAHHLCHASLAFNNSGFDEALVIVIDRNGTIIWHNNQDTIREAESVFQFNHPEKIKYLYKSFWMVNSNHIMNYDMFMQMVKAECYDCDIHVKSAYSIVKVYEAATSLIGQHPLENGKTMGLAAYGTQEFYPPLFIDQTPIDAYFHHEVDGMIEPRAVPVRFADTQPPKTYEVTKENYLSYAEKAKHVQLETQRTALNLIRRYVEKTGIKNICVTGGYGLNVVANSYYKENLPDCNFYFEPLADDSGNSIGACMHTYRLRSHDTNKWPLTDTFYHYYEDEKLPDLGIQFVSKQANLKHVAKLLADKKAVAFFEGAPEAGPRALGHRSILFDCRDVDTKDKINEIKNREWYRPFAGVLQKQDLETYFDPLFEESPHMTVNYTAKQEAKDKIPGVLHVDGTSRIQTVTDGNIYNLLKEYKNITNVGCLLNTSFNMAGDPLIQTKQQALDMLLNTKLHAVYFADDGVIVTKSI